MITPEEIVEIIKNVVEGEIEIKTNTPLIGGNSIIDSMSLVQTCIALEDKSQEHGFNFDWTSEKAMSSMSSVFKSPLTLANEYNRQFKKH